MFAYCNNNPILYVDLDGKSVGITWVVCSDASAYSKQSPHYPSTESIKLKSEAMANKPVTREEWDALTNAKRIEYAEEYFSYLVTLLKIDNYTISFESMSDPSLYGSTGRYSNVIRINIGYSFLSNYELLGTIAHECYHAYQYNVVDGLINHKEPDYVVIAWEKDFARDTINMNYIQYRNLFTEISAFWFEDNLDIEYWDKLTGIGYYR